MVSKTERAIIKKKRQRTRNRNRLNKSRMRMEEMGDLSTKKNETLHVKREEKALLESIEYLNQMEMEEYFQQRARENDDCHQYYNPIQKFSRGKIYEECSFGSDCFCEDGCQDTSYLPLTLLGMKCWHRVLTGSVIVEDFVKSVPTTLHMALTTKALDMFVSQKTSRHMTMNIIEGLLYICGRLRYKGI